MVRPRLTPREVVFLARVLREFEVLMRWRREQMDKREDRIKQLRRKAFLEGTHHFKEMELEKEQLSKDKQAHYYDQAEVARGLAKRFEAMSQGGHLHTGWWTKKQLERLELVPKTA